MAIADVATPYVSGSPRFGSGVTWAVALALSLHSKLRRELPYDVLSHFSVHDVKACVTETGDFCLEVARGQDYVVP